MKLIILALVSLFAAYAVEAQASSIWRMEDQTTCRWQQSWTGPVWVCR